MLPGEPVLVNLVSHIHLTIYFSTLDDGHRSPCHIHIVFLGGNANFNLHASVQATLTLTFKKSRTFSRVFGERGLVTFGWDKSKGL